MKHYESYKAVPKCPVNLRKVGPGEMPEMCVLCIQMREEASATQRCC